MNKNIVGLIALSLVAFTPLQAKQKADILIKGGTLYDGNGGAPKVADVVISGDRIIFVGEAGKKFNAQKIIDASGSVVCPGFIDPHSHLEKTLLKTKSAENYLRMGVTTAITGMCGGSRVPLSEYFATLEQQGIGLNTASFTGHNTLRSKVMGSVARKAGKDEIAKMEEIFSKDIETGSLGLSTGLYYVPGCFAGIEEVEALCRLMKPSGCVYTTHIRFENKFGIALLGSIEEALNVGRNTGVPVNISHIKCLGKSVWHQSDKVIAAVEKAQAEGLKVTADQYPYPASYTGFSGAVTPAWSRDGGNKGLRRRLEDPVLFEKLKLEIPEYIEERGGAESIMFPSGQYKGKTLAELAGEMGLSPTEAAMEILKKESPSVVTFVMCEDDIENFMKQPWVMTGTDGDTIGLHPRSCGTFAEKIQKYVLAKKILSLGDMIRRSSGMVAETYGLKGRGKLEKDYYADVIVFKPEEIRANATFQAPAGLATGFQYVIVNGTVAVDHDKYTGSLSGKVLRKNK